MILSLRTSMMPISIVRAESLTVRMSLYCHSWSPGMYEPFNTTLPKEFSFGPKRLIASSRDSDFTSASLGTPPWFNCQSVYGDESSLSLAEQARKKVIRIAAARRVYCFPLGPNAGVQRPGRATEQSAEASSAPLADRVRKEPVRCNASLGCTFVFVMFSKPRLLRTRQKSAPSGWAAYPRAGPAHASQSPYAC